MELPIAAADTVIARIQAAHEASPRGAIAFDGDGTLWSGDIGDDFFHATVAAGRFLPPAIAAMTELASAFLAEPSAPDVAAVPLAKRLFAAYLDGRVPEDTICEFIAWACAGWTREEVYAFASQVVKGGRVHERLHQELAPVLAWAKGAGVDTILVSASPRPVVEVAGALLGFSPDRILAATAPFASDVMLATVERPIPYGSGKATLLERRLAGRPLLAAFGDNIFDVPMLRAAQVPVAVEPKPRLLAALSSFKEESSVPGLVRLAMGTPKCP